LNLPQIEDIKNSRVESTIERRYKEQQGWIYHREKIQRLGGLNLPKREEIEISRVESTIERRYRD